MSYNLKGKNFYQVHCAFKYCVCLNIYELFYIILVVRDVKAKIFNKSHSAYRVKSLIGHQNGKRSLTNL